MLSFTLSGKHMSYAYTHLTHKTIIGNINFMHLYYELIQVLLLITSLCLFQDSRRSYKTYTFTDLCLFRTPVGVTELILILRSLHWFGDTRRYRRDYGTCTGIVELILIRKYL